MWALGKTYISVCPIHFWLENKWYMRWNIFDTGNIKWFEYYIFWYPPNWPVIGLDTCRSWKISFIHCMQIGFWKSANTLVGLLLNVTYIAHFNITHCWKGMQISAHAHLPGKLTLSDILNQIWQKLLTETPQWLSSARKLVIIQGQDGLSFSPFASPC